MNAPAPSPGPKAPRWAWWVASGFGSGYLRPAPGTWGSLAGLLGWMLTMDGLGRISEGLGGGTLTTSGHLSHPVWALIPLLGALFGTILIVRLGIKASTLFSRELGVEDPSCIVIDEWAGMWIALLPLALFLPFNSPLKAILHWRTLTASGFSPWEQLAPVLVAFSAFRLFDIWKPWPCHQIQELQEGEGIMADDVVAGLYAMVIVIIWQAMDHRRMFPWPIPPELWHH